MKSALRGKEISSQGHGKRPKGRLALPPFEGHLKQTPLPQPKKGEKKERRKKSCDPSLPSLSTHSLRK
jgi:hypothetical protein